MGPEGEQAKRGLGLFDGDRVFGADLDAALASEAFLSVRREGFPVPHLKYLDRADVHAFFAANAFFFVDGGVKSHQQISFRWFMISWPQRAIQFVSAESINQLNMRVKHCWSFFFSVNRNPGIPHLF